MLIFLSFGLIVCCFVIEKIMNNQKNKGKFAELINKSDFGDNVTKSDLISFRHEIGETIFEIQKEIEEIKASLDNIQKQNNDS